MHEKHIVNVGRFKPHTLESRIRQITHYSCHFAFLPPVFDLYPIQL
jgi:hypothetical protein